MASPTQCLADLTLAQATLGGVIRVLLKHGTQHHEIVQAGERLGGLLEEKFARLYIDRDQFDAVRADHRETCKRCGYREAVKLIEGA
jgi:hypothetical protein